MTTMLHRFAKLVVACTVLLILAGSLVTSHDAGLSVPDWPTSYGWNMFTFPPSMWVANIFYEHGHRLIASTVGFLTIILATWLWLADARPWLKWFGAAALGAIIAQGVLGGLTVLFFLPAAVSTAHAALAEIFLCMTVAIALFTSPRWMEGYGTAEAAPYGAEPDDAAPHDAVPYSAENPLVVSLSNHEPNRSSFDRPVPGKRLILRQAQDERGVEGPALSKRLILRQAQDERRVEGPVLSKRLILRQAQDEPRVEGLRTSECIDDVTLRRLATATTALIFLQILIGAAMRHTGAGLAIPDFPWMFGHVVPDHWNGRIAVHFTHRAGALIVTLGIGILSAYVWSHHRGRRELAQPAALIVALVVIQVTLGALTVLTRRDIWINSLHVVCGALVLTTSLVLTLRSWRARFAPAEVRLEADTTDITVRRKERVKKPRTTRKTRNPQREFLGFFRGLCEFCVQRVRLQADRRGRA